MSKNLSKYSSLIRNKVILNEGDKMVIEENQVPDVEEPDKFKDLKKTSINIITWADVDKRTGHCWADFWIKKRFEYHLRSLGFQVNVVPEIADISIYLWGAPMPLKFPTLYNPSSYNIAWAYSHIQRMNKEEAKKYDRIYSLSEIGSKILCRVSSRTLKEPLLPCSDFVENEEKIENDIVFIGNARGNLTYGRKIIRDLDYKWNLALYGHKWPSKIGYNKKWYKGRYFDYDKLNQLYGGAKISLNDHQEDAVIINYVNFRILDILCSGGFCVSDYNPGVNDMFGDCVPMAANSEELNRKINTFFHDKEVRKELSLKGKKIAESHRFIDRIKTILNNEEISYGKEASLKKGEQGNEDIVHRNF